MTDGVVFDDGAAYEAFMGRWSHAVGRVFLHWCAPALHARWLDVGCGTGVFTELVIETCAPAAVAAVDPAAAQIAHARRRPMAARVDFRVADAQALPFPAGAFDVVASALVLNFCPDPAAALAEMRRVAGSGGLVAAYVWNFAEERSPTWPLAQAMRRIGVEPPRIPGADITPLERLRALFERTGLHDVSVREIDVTMEFPDFEAYWHTQTPAFNPLGRIVAAMTVETRDRLMKTIREALCGDGGTAIRFAARAHAVRAYAP